MTEVIRCPSCGAPLQAKTGLPDRCDFCGSRLVNRNPKEEPGSFTPPAETTSRAKTPIFFVALGIGLLMAVMGGTVAFLTSEVEIDQTLETLQQPAEDAGKTDKAELAFAEENLRFGGEGTGVGKFTDNRVIGVAGNGDVYSADYIGGRVQVFDKQGKFIRQWYTENQYIQDLTVGRDGTVYVTERSELSAYDGATGRFLAKAPRGTFGNVFAMPDGSVLAATFQGDIWKLDAKLNKKAVYKDVMRQAGSDAPMISDMTANGLGEVYILDFMGKNVFHFSPELRFIDRFKPDIGLMMVTGIAIDPKDRIFLSAVNEIHVFDNEGRRQESFPTQQTFGMTFDDDGNLWTASRPYILRYKINR